MKKLVLLSLALAAGGCTAERPPAQMSGNAQNSLQAELAGRVQSGPPVSCVSSRLLGGNRSVGEGAIIFQTTGSGPVYVNRPPGGCPEILSGRALRTRTTSTQLCRGDIVSVFDPVSGIEYGSCGLGDFTPYSRPR